MKARCRHSPIGVSPATDGGWRGTLSDAQKGYRLRSMRAAQSHSLKCSL